MKIKKTFIAFISSIIIIFPCLKVNAAELSLGVSTWYAWWDFNQDNNDDTEMDPALLYGLVGAVSFSNSFSLTALVLYGQFTQHYEDGGQQVEDTIHRVDMDTALNYKLTDSLKIFGGVKYMGYFYENGSHASMGPAIGLGYTYNIQGNLFLLANISFAALFGEEYSDSDDQTVGIFEYGANTNVSLAYYLADASTTLTLGFRYQNFYTEYDDTEYADGDMEHHVYGITASAVYSF